MFSANSSQKSDDKLYVDDVFSTYLYTGNGSTQTITNGIDLAGKGGLVWVKTRADTLGIAGTNIQHLLVDSERGIGNWLVTNTTDGQQTNSLITAFNPNGYSFGGRSEINANTNTYVSWTFRKAPKFFDVVTYTGNDTYGRAIPHNLGTVPGMIIVKNITQTNTDWYVLHRSMVGTMGVLNQSLAFAEIQSNAAVGGAEINKIFGDGTNYIAPTATSFTVGEYSGTGEGSLNQSSTTYVAYLFAHDTTADGVIQCGSYTGNTTSPPLVTLGWEPQFVLVKRTDGVGGWVMCDVMRGMSLTSSKALEANTSSVEYDPGGTVGPIVIPNAVGFTLTPTSNAYWNSSGSTYIYLAIRRPNKPPTTGTQVYNAVLQDANNVARTISGAGFVPDLLLQGARQYANGTLTYTRLTDKVQITYSTSAETNKDPTTTSFTMDGISYGGAGLINNNGLAVDWFFKRAPGFFDVVCYTGTGVARIVPHNLGVAPELMIVKQRSSTQPWCAYSKYITVIDGGVGSLPERAYISLNTSNPANDATTAMWNATRPTPTAFSVKSSNQTNANGATYVAYLFSSLPGIQWINSYVGDGTTGRVINCGFTTGARFVMVKATSTTGSWWIFDSARGIVSAADPVLQLNSTSAEDTSADAIDPHSSGFIVNQEATCSLNASGVNYLVWSIA